MTATTDPTIQGFPLYRHYYLHVSSEAQNRLTISTFLGGLTFASFAALLSATSLSSWTVQTILSAAIDILLGTATFLFLLTVAGTYTALQHLAQLSPTAVKNLGGDPPGAGQPDPVLDSRDVTRLTEAYQTYQEPRHFIPAGLALIFLSLLLIGFQINWLVGIIVTLIFAGLLLWVPALLRAMIAVVQGTSTVWLQRWR